LFKTVVEKEALKDCILEKLKNNFCSGLLTKKPIESVKNKFIELYDFQKFILHKLDKTKALYDTKLSLRFLSKTVKSNNQLDLK